jgi:hypothetical protein
MKMLVGFLTFGFLVLNISNAEAVTCQKRAKNCEELGGQHTACFDKTRMAQCAATKVYVAPSGREWRASGHGIKE